MIFAKDGAHRTRVLHPNDGYREYSRTSSGGIIFTSGAASKERRWLIEHPLFGNKFFAEHDDILKWTVEQMRLAYKSQVIDD